MGKIFRFRRLYNNNLQIPTYVYATGRFEVLHFRPITKVAMNIAIRYHYLVLAGHL